MVLGISCGEDYLVLNSVALVERAFPYLDRYGKIRCYLDNDDAGKKTLAILRKRYGDRIDDCSDLYAGCKDLNEYLESNFPSGQKYLLQTVKTRNEYENDYEQERAVCPCVRPDGHDL